MSRDEAPVLGYIRYLHTVFIGIKISFIDIVMPRLGASIGQMWNVIVLKVFLIPQTTHTEDISGILINHHRYIRPCMIRSKSREELDRILKSIKDTLKDHYNERLENVVLYGSYARNSEGNESDIDIAVILEGEFDKYEEVEKMVDLTNDISLHHDIMISLLPLTSNDYIHGKYSIYKNIRKEGILV
jgi:predicted nucleotidyltransferase